MGRASVKIAGKARKLATGDLLVVDTGISHDVEATEPCALLITISGGTEG
jgi:hypothetical protein